jgi:hypothetical protein
VSISGAGRFSLHFDPQGDLLDATLDCESAVFRERYKLDPSSLTEYHAPYEQSSTFVALADDAGEVFGMTRLIYPSPAGLVTLVNIGRDPWRTDAAASVGATGLDLAKTWDISTLGVRKSSTGQTAVFAAALYHGLIRTAWANQVDGFLAILDFRVRRALSSIGLMVHELPGTGSAPYEGSPSATPVWANVADFVAGQRRTSPEAHRLVTLGVGLDGIAVPATDDFVLRRVIELPEPRPVRVPAPRLVSPDGELFHLPRAGR